MQVSHPDALRSWLDWQRSKGHRVGFVPTMGALHEGHGRLVRQARAENDVVAVSIFVNPTQFNDPKDLVNYPRTLQADSQLLENEGCDVLFAPGVAEMYPDGFEEPPLSVSLNGLDQLMEGAHRPGHFAGVMQVVNKLFDAAGPCHAYFGQKDFQQLAIVRRMTAELQLPVTIVACPIVRETDGLAMSSRNRRLQPHERAVAPLIYQSLELARSLWGTCPAAEIEQQAAALLSREPLFTLEYFQIVDADSLQPVAEGQMKNAVACIAARLGVIRLIDNAVLG
ncbi:MAG: pantoate--beta-alanine ligase [Bacteroidetes bacterium]|nr:pantoate--beta-alanine ligase [Bacteroidota bacterium]